MAIPTSDILRQPKRAPTITAQLKSQRADTFEVRDDTETVVNLEVWSDGKNRNTSEYISFILTTLLKAEQAHLVVLNARKPKSKILFPQTSPLGKRQRLYQQFSTEGFRALANGTGENDSCQVLN